MAVLTYLIENRNRVVTKEELLAGVWPGTSVNDGNVHVNISNIRDALEQHGGRNFIKTISTQGYHFSEPVEESSPESSTPVSETESSRGTKAGKSRLRRRVWPRVLGVAALLTLVLGCLGMYKYEQYVRSPRHIASIFLINAIRTHNAGHDQESIELARKAIAADPSLIRAYLLAAWWESLNTVDDRTNQTDEILDQLKNQKSAPSQTQIQMEEGMRSDNHGDIAEAMRYFREATVLSPGDIDAWRMYGFELYSHELNFDKAADAFRACLSIEPHDTDCVVGLLQAQNALNQFDNSIKFFDALPEDVKQTPYVLEEFGFAQLGQEHYNLAMDAFEREDHFGQSENEASATDGSINGRIQAMLLSGVDPGVVAGYIENEIHNYNGPAEQKANWEIDLASVDATSGREGEGREHISSALAISDSWQESQKIDTALVDVDYALRLLAMCRDFEDATETADLYSTSDESERAATKLFIEGMREMASPRSTQGAVRAFEQAYETHANPLYDFYLGQELLSIGDSNGAEQALHRFLDHRGEFQEGYIGLALLIPRAEKELATIKD